MAFTAVVGRATEGAEVCSRVDLLLPEADAWCVWLGARLCKDT